MTTIRTTATKHNLDLLKLKYFEQQLENVMELTDTKKLEHQLHEVMQIAENQPSEINLTRLGIIYHETALNFSFLSKTHYEGYAEKSFAVLTELYDNAETSTELMPFIASYRASALALLSAETKQLKLLNDAFKLFNEAVSAYAAMCYLPEFLRGSVAENLPWFLWRKRRFAKLDFQSIINKQHQNKSYANPKIMSFVYWAWAKQRPNKKYRSQALEYLDIAIFLDPYYEGGRQKAEELKGVLSKNASA